jgi:hypothetical protein
MRGAKSTYPTDNAADEHKVDGKPAVATPAGASVEGDIRADGTQVVSVLVFLPWEDVVALEAALLAADSDAPPQAYQVCLSSGDAVWSGDENSAADWDAWLTA